MTNAEYLRDIKFPDAKEKPGPSVRAGDFSEILIADYIEHVLGYWSPKALRYADRFNRNDSTKGVDVIGFRFEPSSECADDELIVFETKSGFSKSKNHRLQDAITDSGKDKTREGMTLNALKQRLIKAGDAVGVQKIQRFQQPTKRPFKRVNGAAAILEESVFDDLDCGLADGSTHPNAGNLRLLVIKGPSMMQLVHALYERAANEA